MKKLLVFQHVPYEILGTLDPLLRGAGFRIRYVNFGRHPDAEPSLDGYHGLVVLGGPMNVDEVARYPHLTTEMRLIERAVEAEVPVLGICLGAQLIARTLGAEVKRSPRKEIGWYDVRPTGDGKRDPLLGAFGESERVFQWHGDTFDIPDGAVHLADADGCPSQAFRYGMRVYGLQFHLEVDEPMVHRWLEVPSMRREIEELDGAVDPEAIRRDTGRHIGGLRRLSDRTFGAFVELCGAPRKVRILPSR